MKILMDKLVIKGGNPLKGNITISGSKNAVLPMMAGCLLAEGNFKIDNVPNLRDVRTMAHLLRIIGARVQFEDQTLSINTEGCSFYEAPYDLVKTMRASIYVLGPLLSKFGYARVSLPGGCAWGPRPINLHIEGLKKMGAAIDVEKGYVIAKAKKLKGANILFDLPSVGATGNLLLAAVLADGVTQINNAAIEPEITALAEFLNQMGAKIEGVGTDKLIIEGVKDLKPVHATVIPDRIEVGTFLVAGHITKGQLKLLNSDPAHVQSIIQKLKDTGAQITEGPNWIAIQSSDSIEPVNVTTRVYPGFPTDMQAQWMVLMSLAKGSSIVTDTIFHDRFTHVAELQRLGADIILDNNVAIIKGTDNLSGAPVMSTDLRASASLVLAGLVAEGQTDISRIYHLDRGYENLEKKLSAVGADIQRDHETLVT